MCICIICVITDTNIDFKTRTVIAPKYFNYK